MKTSKNERRCTNCGAEMAQQPYDPTRMSSRKGWCCQCSAAYNRGEDIKGRRSADGLRFREKREVEEPDDEPEDFEDMTRWFLDDYPSRPASRNKAKRGRCNAKGDQTRYLYVDDDDE
jgi:hypothetical protein